MFFLKAEMIVPFVCFRMLAINGYCVRKKLIVA